MRLFYPSVLSPWYGCKMLSNIHVLTIFLQWGAAPAKKILPGLGRLPLTIGPMFRKLITSTNNRGSRPAPGGRGAPLDGQRSGVLPPCGAAAMGAVPAGCCLQGRRPQMNRATTLVYIYKLETENWKPPTRAPALFPCAVLLSFLFESSLIDKIGFMPALCRSISTNILILRRQNNGCNHNRDHRGDRARCTGCWRLSRAFLAVSTTAKRPRRPRSAVRRPRRPRLVNEAIKTATQKKKEAILEAKDEVFQMKAEVDAPEGRSRPGDQAAPGGDQAARRTGSTRRKTPWTKRPKPWKAGGRGQEAPGRGRRPPGRGRRAAGQADGTAGNAGRPEPGRRPRGPAEQGGRGADPRKGPAGGHL